MMKTKAIISLALSATLAAPALAEEILIKVLTENTSITKASAQDPEGGEATRFVETLLQTAKITYDLQFVPWRRGYQQAKNSHNTLLFPLARTRERESSFHWVGELVPLRYYLFQLKNREDLILKGLDSARKYRIGVVNYHAHHEYLLHKGFKNLQPVNSYEQNIKKLLLHRIDFFPLSDGAIFPLCQRTQINCERLKPALPLDEIATGMYMAFGLDTDPTIIKLTTATYQKLLADGTHETIFAKRLASLKRFHESWQ